MSLAKLISKKINQISSTIYRLFQSVIEARTNFLAIFQQAASENPDPELLRQNDSHKHFIDALIEAFRALGGDGWASGREPRNERPGDKEDVEQIIFANKFDVLDLNEPKADGEDNDVTSDDEPIKNHGMP